jgi:hypothetical protein
MCTARSCRESIRDVGTHPIRAKQCLEQRAILEDKKRTVLNKNPLMMNEMKQRWSIVHQMNTPNRSTIGMTVKVWQDSSQLPRYKVDFLISANLRIWYTNYTTISFPFFCSTCILRSESPSTGSLLTCHHVWIWHQCLLLIVGMWTLLHGQLLVHSWPWDWVLDIFTS